MSRSMCRFRPIPRTLPSTLYRAGFSTRGLLLAMVVVLGVPAIAWSVFRSDYWSSQKDQGPTMHRVERDRFLHELVEQGDVESARNVEIVSKVKSGYGSGSGGTAILWIIPEGTYVEPGDKVVELDASPLELERIQQEIVVRNSGAGVTQARNALEAARISKQEYLEGTYEEELLSMANQIEEATERRDRLQEYWEFSKNMNEQGYVTDLQLQADYSALLQAENQLKLTLLKRDVLEQYKRKKMELQLDADISTAEARLAAEEDSHRLDQERLDDIVQQIASCTIYTETAGQVVYANREGRRSGEGQIIIEEGTLIRERQTIIRLPDPKNMQVAAEINEAKVSLVKRGMSATIRLDAFPGEVLRGEVVDVNEYPAPTGFGTTVKEYTTIVKILDPKMELRPGYTADVRILVEQFADVLQVPVQALIEHESKHYCVVRDGDRFKAREVMIGSTNDKFVVIERGLDEGESVVFNAAAYRDEIGLPERPAEVDAPREQFAEEQYAEYERGPSQPDDGLGPGPPRDGMPSPAQMLRTLDTNGNGQIDADELESIPGEMRSQLMAADANGDGAIDSREWAAAMAQFRSAARDGGPPSGGRGDDPRPRPPGGPNSGIAP